jgi:hypothetical protein
LKSGAYVEFVDCLAAQVDLCERQCELCTARRGGHRSDSDGYTQLASSALRPSAMAAPRLPDSMPL